MPAVLSELFTILVSKPIFLVSDYDQVRDDEAKTGVRKQIRRPEKPGLRKQYENQANVHRISDVTIKPNHDQLPSFVKGGQCSLTYVSKRPDAPQEEEGSERQYQHCRVLSYGP